MISRRLLRGSTSNPVFRIAPFSTAFQEPVKAEKPSSSILDVDNSLKQAISTVRKFDYYAYRKHNHVPVSLQPHYFGIHAFFLEVLRSREISKEISIC